MRLDIKNAIGSCIDTQIGNIRLVRLLGKGKSGYSYLGRLDDSVYTVKLMHNEPCTYYSFGESNKVDIEVRAFQVLKKLGLPIPKLYFFDPEKNFLVKEHIEGLMATELIARGIAEKVIEQLIEMSRTAKDAGINLDYFPANFVSKEGTLYYIDYEFNPYLIKWDFFHWGIYYWANTAGMKRFLKTGDISALNESIDSGIPIKEPFETTVEYWRNKFCIPT